MFILRCRQADVFATVFARVVVTGVNDSATNKKLRISLRIFVKILNSPLGYWDLWKKPEDENLMSDSL